MRDIATGSGVFRPRRPWWGGDLQTLRNFTGKTKEALVTSADDHVSIDLGDGTGDRMIGALNRPSGAAQGSLIVLIHGISGCADSRYMQLSAAFFVALGHPVLRLNLRGAGPSRRYCRREYHAGSSSDLAALFNALDPALTRTGIQAIGFSLGGNVLLKFLGTVGRQSPIRRAATVSSPIDLALSCQSLQRWRNIGYHHYILSRLKRQCMAPGAELSDIERHSIQQARSLWQFDDTFTAPRNGYRGAHDYYRQNSAQNFLHRVTTPTLMIHARNDPFVPITPYADPRWHDHAALHLLLPAGGGHMGFHDTAGLWHLRQIHRFFQST